MKIAIAYPPLKSGKGVALLTQNRQFQWFSRPTYIFPVVPATAATMLKKDGLQNVTCQVFADYAQGKLDADSFTSTITQVIQSYYAN